MSKFFFLTFTENKHEVANVAGQVYLGSIAHSTTHDDAKLTVRNLINADPFNGKVKNLLYKNMAPKY